jgi:hypothetical protein
MAQQPCRQLNSIAIRDEVLAHIIPLVRSKCSVLGVKCVWRVQGGVAGIQSAWDHIVTKRNQCDAIVGKTPGVALFFSSISTYQPAKRDDSEEHDEENEISQSQGSSGSISSSQVNQVHFKLIDVFGKLFWS